MKILRAPRIERCIGCHSCSLACARLVHQRISWSTAGIRIVSSGGLSTGFEPKLCLACDPAPCAQACPTGSYTQRKTGGVKVDKSLCIRCGACAKACPVDAIYMEPETDLPYVCIHCGRCVPFCPHDCLALVPSPHEKKALTEEGLPNLAAMPASSGPATKAAAKEGKPDDLAAVPGPGPATGGSARAKASRAPNQEVPHAD